MKIISVAVFVILIPIYFNTVFCQNTKISQDSSFLRLIYFHQPDSILLDNKLIFPKQGEMIAVKPGIHKVEVSKQCYIPITKNVTAMKGTKQNVILYLRPQNYKEQFSFYLNSALSTSLLLPPLLMSFFNSTDENRPFKFPSAMGFLGQLWWIYQKSEILDPCYIEYVFNKNEKEFKINIGLSSVHSGIINVTESFRYNFTDYKFNTLRKYSLKPTSSFLFNIQLSIEARKYIYKYLFGKLLLNFTPTSKIDYSIVETNQYGVNIRDFKGSTKPLSMFSGEFSLCAVPVKFNQQSFVIEFGGFYGNINLPDNIYAPTQLTWQHNELYAWDRVDIKSNNYGYFFGVSYDYPILNYFIYEVGLKSYNYKNFDFLVARVGLKYQIF